MKSSLVELLWSSNIDFNQRIWISEWLSQSYSADRLKFQDQWLLDGFSMGQMLAIRLAQDMHSLSILQPSLESNIRSMKALSNQSIAQHQACSRTVLTSYLVRSIDESCN